MEFLLIDVSAAVAALLGYVAYVALERQWAQRVHLRRTLNPAAHSLP
jgi:hypothetical protein